MATRPEDEIPGSAPPGWMGGVGVPVNGSETSRNLNNAAGAMVPFLPALALGARGAALASRLPPPAPRSLPPALANILGYGAPVAGAAALMSAAAPQPRTAGAAPVAPPAAVPTPVAKPAAPAPVPVAASAQAPAASRAAVKPAAPKGAGSPATPATAPTPAEAAAPVVNMDAFRALQEMGLARELGGGILAAGGLPGSDASFAIPWASASAPTQRAGDVQVIRGNESTYATPELGMSNLLQPEMYFGSLMAGGDMKQAAEMQRLQQLVPQAIQADATVEAAKIREAGGTVQAGIAAGAQNLATKTQRELEILKLLGTPVQGGGELASDPNNPLLPPVAVPTFQRRVLRKDGGFDFEPMGATADRKAVTGPAALSGLPRDIQQKAMEVRRQVAAGSLTPAQAKAKLADLGIN